MAYRILRSFTENDFREVECYEGVALIRFYAPWCAPCLHSETSFLFAAEQMPDDVMVGDVNVITAPVLAAKYAVWGLPVVLLFSEGQLINRIQAARTAEVYLNEVQAALFSHQSDTTPTA